MFLTNALSLRLISLKKILFLIKGRNFQSLNSPCGNNITAGLLDSRLEVMFVIKWLILFILIIKY